MSNYQKLKQDIAKIAVDCGRKPEEILLIAVSKGYSWETASEIYQEGCRNFGENRLQEALPKIETAPQNIRWHFIGTLQKNKVRKAVGMFALIHTVESLELAHKISECSLDRSLTTSILIQVNTSSELSKHGMTEEQFERDFDSLQNLPALKIEGLMTMAPLTEEESVIRDCFRKLGQLRDRYRLQHLSMGMSHDYPIAIEEGATMLRIGTALFE